MIKKIFLGLVALFFVFIGALWMLFSYVKNNPDSIYKAITKTVESFTEGEPYEEMAEESIHNLQVIFIQSKASRIQIVPGDGEEIKIIYQGKAPKMEKGPFIEKFVEGVQLKIFFHEPLASSFVSMNVNGEQTTKATDVALAARIFIPKSYKGLLKIETREAPVDISLSPESIYEFDLQSNSGNIDNESRQGAVEGTEEVGKIEVKTDSGPISVTSPIEQ